MSKNKPKTKFVIIDGHAIIHRAYHALPPLTSPDGRMVNAVYGFSSMLLKVIEDLKPTHLAVSFDVKGPTFRDEVYKEYKAHREKADQELYDQIPWIHEVVEALHIPIYTKEGYEADDVIGSIATTVRDDTPEAQVIIVTGDKDILQLVDDDCIEVYLLKRGMSEFELYNEEAVEEKFGFGSDFIPDYKALMGDPSDNIKGVKGVGKKTAGALIKKYQTIEKLYEALHSDQADIKGHVKKKLLEGEDDAKLSKTLATIVQDIDDLEFSIEASKFDAPKKDLAPLYELFQGYAFSSLLKRLVSMFPQAIGDAVEVSAVSVEELEFEEIHEETVENVMSILKKEETIACYMFVHEQHDLFDTSDTVIVLATESQGFWCTFSGCSPKTKQRIARVLSQKGHTLIGHDIKQLLKLLLPYQTEWQASLFDLMIASYITDVSTRAHDIDSLIQRELHDILDEINQKKASLKEKRIAAQKRIGYFLTLHKRFNKRLEEEKNKELFETIEMPLVPVLAQMEKNGIAIDTARLEELSQEVHTKIDTITKQIWEQAGEEFNVASSQQLRDILFDKMGIPTAGIKKGKTGYSTAASELEKIRDLDPIIPLIEEHRELAKLQNTYIDVLPTLVNSYTGRIHTSFNQTVAATGRLSSSDPNLQNIPVRTQMGRHIRDAFISEDGFVLLAADYSQIELRIVASLAKDEQMIEIFKQEEDIHTATAARINGVPLQEVTKQMRSAAKEVNFGVLYGMSAYGLSERTGLSHAEAKQFIDRYFSTFSGVKKYIDTTIATAKECGYVETMFGRRRPVPELQSSNFQMRNAGERMAVNMPIQGTQADIIKIAMKKVHDYIEEKYALSYDEQGKVRGDVRMVLQVHDELILEVKKGKEKEISAMVEECMKQVVTPEVPIVVNVKLGKRWSELEAI